MKRLYYILTFSVFSLMFACEREEGVRPLVNIDSLINSQVNHLNRSDAHLTKIASMKGKFDTVSYQPKDTLQWMSELSIFRELEVINKPVSRASYLIDDGLYDPSSNLMVKVFTSTTDIPVRSLRIYYENTPMKPRKIEAVYVEANALYRSTRLLYLEFQQINNIPTLTSYSIEGGQKMMLSDSVSFQVKGKIQVN